jgi:microcin C transport system substrate-binding protein
MNNLLVKFLLALVVSILTACSGDNAPENTAENSPAVNQTDSIPVVPETGTAPVVENLPEYPVSVLPEGLVWETNDSEPVFADPDAKKGGTFREYMESFPLTLRTAGPDANSGLYSYLLANQLSLIDIHPNTKQYLPALATHWAYGEDNKTVYFRLNPDAKWSDGKAVTADDYLFSMEFGRSEFIVSPFRNTYFTKEIVDIRKYDNYTISVTGGTAKPKEDLLLYYAISPTPRHFHKLDANWVQDYTWLVEPNTGPYQITRVEKGKYVEFTRNQEWWGNDLKYFQHRYNVDKVRIDVIRDPETAYRYFLRGELDTAILTFPNYWHDKTGDQTYLNGYIHKIWFYNDLPHGASGIFLNLDYELFKDINVRYGFAHSMNIQKMIDTVLRGDYQRQHTFSTGYGDYSNLDIRAREFDLAKADEYFRLAGWEERGPDGIRIKDGTRLAITLAYSTQLHTDRLVVLREEAKKAGVDLQLNLLDGASYYKNVMEKKHQAAWMAWSTNLRPEYSQYFLSEYAHKPVPNNVTNTDDPEMDKLVLAYQDSNDTAERAQLARNIQAKVNEMGSYIPSYYVPFVRQGHWRWVILPDGHGTRLSDALFDPMGLGLFWIDSGIKEQTLAAMKAGQKFEPVTIVDETWKVEN